MHKKKKRSTKWIIAVLIVIALGAAFMFVRGGKKPVYEKVRVTRGDIAAEVSVTGRVKSAESVNLAFEKGGKVKNVSVKVGDRVSPGQALVHLDTSELAASLLQAEASVDMQMAKLNELKNGTRPEELQVKETELKKASQDLVNYYGGVLDLSNDAYAKADDAVRTKTDQLFLNDDTDTPQLTFLVSDSQAQIDAIVLRRLVTKELNAWRAELKAALGSSSSSTLEGILVKSEAHLFVIRDFLTRVLDVVDKATGMESTTSESYKASIGTGRTNVSTSISNLSAQDQAITAQKVVVERIMDELALKRAGSTDEAIAAQEAQVKQVEANAASIRAQLAKSVLYAPIKGIVTKQDAKLGEIAAPSVPLVSIIADQNLEIEVNVPEVDVGKIAIGNVVRVKLDAFPGEEFTAAISYIDPAETIIDGVVNFKVTIHFTEPNARARSGLTANLKIESLKREGVLILPEFAVVENDAGTFVRTLSADGRTTTDIPVKLGVRSDEGVAEIVEGVSEGTEVINVGLKASTE